MPDDPANEFWNRLMISRISVAKGGGKNGGNRQASSQSKSGAVNKSNSGTRRSGSQRTSKNTIFTDFTDQDSSSGTSIDIFDVLDLYTNRSKRTASGKWCPPWMGGELGKPNAAKEWIPHAVPQDSEGVVAGEIIAWRAWYFDPERKKLRSIFVDYEWPYNKPATGRPDLGYGIHAFKSKGRVEFEYDACLGDLFVGQVALWGDVVEFEGGYTAEFAKVYSLYAPKNVKDLYGIKED